MIVIDVGCARLGGDYSVERLIDWYHPDVLIGFDPTAKVAEAMPADLQGTNVVLRREAAWIEDGEIGYFADGVNSQVGNSPGWPKVRAVDLARVIRELPEEEEVIIKIDAEGAEYELLEHLLATGAIDRVSRLLIEWHPRHEGGRRRAIEEGMRARGVVWEQWRW